MIPIKLKIKNFLSYHEEVVIDFSALHLACISGNNGAGKSSILDAMVWALFGKARRNDDSLIFSGEVHGSVVLEFEYEGARYLVERDIYKKKSGKVIFSVYRGNDQWSSFSGAGRRDTDTQIRDVLRMDYDTFTNASFFLQGKADQFTQTKPGDRKAILSNILGLEIWKTYQERASQRRKALDIRKIGFENQRLNALQEILREEEYNDSLKQIQKELDAQKQVFTEKQLLLQELKKKQIQSEAQQKQVNLLQQQLSGSRKQLDTLEVNLRQAKQNVEEYQKIVALSDGIEKEFIEWQALLQKLDGLNSLSRQVQAIKDEMLPYQRQIEAERIRLENQLVSLDKQKNLANQAEQQLPEKQREYANQQANIERITKELQDESQVADSIQQMQERLADKKASIQGSRVFIKEQSERKVELNAVHSPICPLCGQDLTPDHLNLILTDIEQDIHQAEANIRLDEGEQQKSDSELRVLQQKWNDLQKSKTNLNEIVRAQDKTTAWISEQEKLIMEWHTTGLPVYVSTTEALKTEGYATESKESLDKLQVSLDQLGYDPQVHTQVDAQEKKVRQAGEKKTELAKAQSDLAHTQAGMDQIQLDISQKTEELTLIKSSLENASALLIDMQDGLERLDGLQKEVDEFELKISNLNQQKGAVEEKIKGIDAAKEQVKDLSQKKAELAENIDQYKILEHAFSNVGIPALLIEQALPEIEEHANNILEQLTNGNMSLKFLTQKELKTKEEKKEVLEIQISDTNGIRDYELYSGGESFRVNFALRLALSQVLAQRSGARLQTLVIDEGFGSQDAAGRSRLIEAINTVQNNFALILIITHLEELKDAFPSRIEVEKTSNGSTVKVLI